MIAHPATPATAHAWHPAAFADAFDHVESLATLADGQRVAIRPMRGDDGSAEQALVNGLSQQSRYQRFHFGIPAVSPGLLKRLTVDVDQRGHVAFVAEAAQAAIATGIGAGTGTANGLVGDARYVRSNDNDDAEFALTVADAWQGRGLGRLLLDHLRSDARAHGVAALCGDVLWSNTAMIGLARSIGASLQRHPGDATLVRVRLVP